MIFARRSGIITEMKRKDGDAALMRKIKNLFAGLMASAVLGGVLLSGVSSGGFHAPAISASFSGGIVSSAAASLQSSVSSAAGTLSSLLTEGEGLTGGLSALVSIDGEGTPEGTDPEYSERSDDLITGGDVVVDTDYCLYYTFLSKDEQRLYKQIYANALAGVERFAPICTVKIPQLRETLTAVFYDHPGLFWVDTNHFSYSYTKENTCSAIRLQYHFTGEELKIAQQQFEEVSNQIVEYALTCSTDYERERYVHDCLIQINTYDEEAPFSQSAYSALVGGRTVCAGFSRAFQYIMNRLHIPTYFCVGNSETHAWNIVCLEGGYYNVDLTGDSNDVYGLIHYFFNGTDEDFADTHERCGASVFLPKCEGGEYRCFGEGFLTGNDDRPPEPPGMHLGEFADEASYRQP